jgi:uncharacterized membrane protein YhaH (DUF805 family)
MAGLLRRRWHDLTSSNSFIDVVLSLLKVNLTGMHGDIFDDTKQVNISMLLEFGLLVDLLP